MSRYLCLKRQTHEVAYEADSLPAVQGFIDGAGFACRVMIELESRTQKEFMYRLAVVDRTTGQIVCAGPVVDLFAAGDALESLAIAVLPIDIADRSYLLKDRALNSLDCLDDDDDAADEWKGGAA